MNKVDSFSKLNIAILLLAAGASRRMGQAKQLLKITPTQTLIAHTIGLIQTIPCQQSAVILGANAALIEPVIATENIPIVHNPNWKKGMGTSVQYGLRYVLQQTPDLEAVLLLVCDQPYLTRELLQELINTYQYTQSPIIASKYENEQLGVPALLTKQFFPQLLALEEDRGARKIIQQHLHLVSTIPFPKGSIDLDTPEAYQAYLLNSK